MNEIRIGFDEVQAVELTLQITLLSGNMELNIFTWTTINFQMDECEFAICRNKSYN